MNKFQKIAYKIAKDDKKNLAINNISLQEINRNYYSMFNSNKSHWPFEKCIDFKNWSKEINEKHKKSEVVKCCNI